jgi:uncharacterized protein
MKVSKERVSGLAALLVEKLIVGEMIEPAGERKALTASLERVMTDELSVEDKINVEVKELMRKYQAEIDRGQMNEQQLFQLIKKQLVKDKKVIL